jgi:hypothetical protein
MVLTYDAKGYAEESLWESGQQIQRRGKKSNEFLFVVEMYSEENGVDKR